MHFLRNITRVLLLLLLVLVGSMLVTIGKIEKRVPGQFLTPCVTQLSAWSIFLVIAGMPRSSGTISKNNMNSTSL